MVKAVTLGLCLFVSNTNVLNAPHQVGPNMLFRFPSKTLLSNSQSETIKEFRLKASPVSSLKPLSESPRDHRTDQLSWPYNPVMVVNWRTRSYFLNVLKQKLDHHPNRCREVLICHQMIWFSRTYVALLHTYFREWGV